MQTSKKSQKAIKVRTVYIETNVKGLIPANTNS